LVSCFFCIIVVPGNSECPPSGIEKKHYLKQDMIKLNNKEMIEPKVGSTLTETKFGMKKVIYGKTFNTETSKKLCGFDVNGWTHELYQTKSGEYFTYIYDGGFLEWCKSHSDGLLKWNVFSRKSINLVTESEVKHMIERSGSVNLDRKETVLTELEDYFSEEGMSLSVTGKCGYVHFDFGSWEITMDVDDENWVKMTTKGKSVFESGDLDEIRWIRNRWNIVRNEYLKGRFGKTNGEE